jgi:hypothetical protein
LTITPASLSHFEFVSDRTIIARGNIFLGLFCKRNPLSVLLIGKKAFWEVHDLLCIKKATLALLPCNRIKIFLESQHKRSFLIMIISMP